MLRDITIIEVIREHAFLCIKQKIIHRKVGSGSEDNIY